MTNELTAAPGSQLAAAGLAANIAAGATAFADYHSRKAANTLRRQQADLALFAEYLAQQGLATDANRLYSTPAAWAGLTWGLVDGFVKWQLASGYAVGSVNVRLSTVKTYSRLAAKAGTVAAADLVLIQAVKGYSGRESKEVDAKRLASGRPRRLAGSKRAEPTVLSDAEAARLQQQPDTPQGRRDRLIVCLMLEQGLRVGEVAGLRAEAFDLAHRRLTFYRPKVDKIQTHKLTPATFAAARSYIGADVPEVGALIWASNKTGSLTAPGLSATNISLTITRLGAAIGLDQLSAHDLRHTWATRAAMAGTPIDRLQQAGGWSNPVTPLSRYVGPAEIANEGVKLK